MGVCTIENIRDICRLCAKSHEHMKPIYINQCTQHNVKFLIQKFLPFINLNENDILPNRICINCTSKLIIFNNLWETTRVANEEFKLLIFKNENKLVVNKEKERKQNNYEDHLHFSKVEDDIDFTPMKQFVQHLTIDIEDISSLKSTTINGYKEKYVTNKSDKLSVTKVVSNNESTCGDGGCRENHPTAATTNFPILLNALMQHKPPPPPDQIYHSDAALDHSYALPPLFCRRGTDGPKLSYDEPVRKHAAPEELAGDHTYAMRGPPETTTAASDDDQPRRNDRHEPPTPCDLKSRTPDEHRCRESESDVTASGEVHEVGGQCELQTGGLDRCAARASRVPGDDVRDHACAQCGRRFTARSTLRMHWRTHTNERPYACEECGKRFRRGTTAKKHVLFVHRKQRDHRCPVCGKAYFTATQVRMHMKWHTGVRNHVCAACGKAFLTKKALAEHGKMVHDGPGGFVCATCGKAYKTMRYLVVHRKLTRCGEGAGDEEDAPPIQPRL